ncbi:TetR/AcrR family transcriptional regulator [Amycolatopsis jiangsuensis]|uniref:AcrR family transcriptional regulator n=1 Tax=Amycolatopsis jiangsuensis TaxID=1181879 RepID=A0A840IPD8_9PSEU|nr:TetR/AcrR family transcriptional regulator [Amycolatopsis jiangsuensis]MBB4683315.1 AcrR family transcriptional regulator [Amycolatopsis jiangsuensis]
MTKPGNAGEPAQSTPAELSGSTEPSGSTAPSEPTRRDRRKARTRRALITAARGFLARQGHLDVSIQDITEAADVGFGSFYNHFSGKDELVRAAIEDTLEEHGRMLDAQTAHLEDPAAVFAASLRATVRLAESHPEIARILVSTGLRYLDRGLAPRALRDITRAIESGQFEVANPHLALATTGGSLLGLVHMRLEHPELLDDDAPEEFAEQLLRAFGMPRRSARSRARAAPPERSPGE